jgi:acyl carrier protein
MEKLEGEIKALIVETLKLEEIAPMDIDSDEPLFVEGLGLDSIDALELGVALRKKYGIKIESISDEVKAHFANVRSLARFVEARRSS